MKSAQELAKRFREIHLNGKWVANTNFKLTLADVTLKQATTQIGTLNTIALLTFHVNYYLAGIINFFETGKLEIHDKHSFELKELTSEEEWTQLVNDLLENAEQFAIHLEQMTDDQLEQTFVDEKYGTYRRNMEGMIEHGYYHLGQISLLKKLVTEGT